MGKDKSGAQKKAPSRSVKRARNLSKQPERKLRHILKRNTVGEAQAWAETHGSLGLLRRLQAELEG